ncbi:hypothetical protein VI817_002817 [Penicillium citrinum]|nr:hypothetical protein VI817_002817 [Penicillium citrinum]
MASHVGGSRNGCGAAEKLNSMRVRRPDTPSSSPTSFVTGSSSRAGLLGAFMHVSAATALGLSCLYVRLDLDWVPPLFVRGGRSARFSLIINGRESVISMEWAE